MNATHSIDQFGSISLEEMSLQTVFSRVDTKYLLKPEQVTGLLEAIAGHFRMLEIHGKRVFSYHTCYFDTPDFRLFLDHHHGYERRMKVRVRSYLDSDMHFFEVKKRHRGLYTEKDRLQIQTPQKTLSEACIKMIDYPRIDPKQLTASLENSFQRMAFVAHSGNERVTVDSNISFTRNGISANASNDIVVEVKQLHPDSGTRIHRYLRSKNIRPLSFSKYVIGLLLTGGHHKYNNFKPTLLKLHAATNTNI